MMAHENFISDNPYFKDLSQAQITKLAETAEIVTFSKEACLFKEGDPADYFYIIIDGDIHITAKNNVGRVVVLARLQKNDYFGEQAFYPRQLAHRRASAIALKESKLLRLHRDTLAEIISADSDLKKLLDKKNSQYLLDKLTKLTKSIQSFEFDFSNFFAGEKSFDAREVLFYQNDMPDYAYLILSGTVQIRFFSKDKQLKSIRTLTAGQLFGESSILHGGARTGIAVAMTPLKVRALPLEQIKSLYEHDDDFRKYCEVLQAVYEIPLKGTMIQYIGEFFGKPALCSLIHRTDNNDIVCQQALNENALVITYTHVKETASYSYESEDGDIRIVNLHDDHLVSIIEKGKFPDATDIVNLFFSAPTITEAALKEFKKTGRFDSLYRTSDIVTTGIVCRCMSVSQTTLIDLIQNKKASSYEAICQATGAGSICGACKPIIHDMLGGDVWTACRIEDIIKHSNTIHSFRFKPISAGIKKFSPGQHVTIKATIDDCEIMRNYTLTSTSDDNYYELTIQREADGLFSNWIFDNASKNPLVYLSDPTGDFTADLAGASPILCFVAGIGVTPAIAFMHALINQSIHNKLCIDYSFQNDDDLIYQSEFEHAEKTHQNFECLLQKTQTMGRITVEHVKAVLAEYANAHIYICGPKEYERFIYEALQQNNVEWGRIHIEQFVNASMSD